MFNKRVRNKRSNNNMYSNQENSITREHKRNLNILEGVLIIVNIQRIKNHMKLLNSYHNHISLGMFSNLSIIKVYNLKEIQLQVLYNSLFYNSYIK